jgi:hypothetical protein
MPTDIADHLDAVIVSESVLRASTVGVHSLVQFREEPGRHLPKLVLAAAGVLVVAAVGVGVVISTADHSNEGAAGINPTVPIDSVPTLTIDQVGPNVQRWLENANGPLLHASQPEVECARNFAVGRSNPEVRLVQQAKVDGKRATVIGVQGGSQRDIQISVVTGCSSPGGVAAPFYETSVTLRNR